MTWQQKHRAGKQGGRLVSDSNRHEEKLETQLILGTYGFRQREANVRFGQRWRVKLRWIHSMVNCLAMLFTII